MDKSTVLRALAALGQETRLDLYRLLSSEGTAGVPAGEIAARLGLVQNTASAHLKILGEAGLIEARRDGRIIRHAIVADGMQNLLAYLTSQCCGGNPAECGFPVISTPNLESITNMSNKVFNVLFLCTGNSARSILAEAILNELGAPNFKAWSAGSQPKGAVHPMSLDLLRHLGHDIGGLRSKSWDEFALPGAPEFDFIFTVCDNAANEACPVWLGHPASAHWGIPDPAAAEGNEAEKRLAFDEAYRQMKNRIAAFIALPIASLDRIKLKSSIDAIGRMQD